MICSVIYYFILLWQFFGWHLWISEHIFSCMMDPFIHWPNPYLLLSTTCDEILSWMIEIWMNIHSVSDGNCNTNIPQPPPPHNLQGMTKNVSLTFNVSDIIKQFTIIIEQYSLDFMTINIIFSVAWTYVILTYCFMTRNNIKHEFSFFLFQIELYITHSPLPSPFTLLKKGFWNFVHELSTPDFKAPNTPINSVTYRCHFY